ncbi:MAG: EamA family transporter [Thermoleophilia bacterium]
MTGVLLGLGAGLCWGAGDFLGGLASKRAHAAPVVVWAQIVGVLMLLTAIVASGAGLPEPRTMLFGFLGGLSAGTGIFVFYRALAEGTMGVVTAVATTAVLVPVTVGLATGERPGTAAGLGVVLVLGGTALVCIASAARTGSGDLRSAGMALIAAACFGTFYVFLDLAADGGALWTVVSARAASIPLVAAIGLRAGASLRPPRAGFGVIAAGGIAETAAVLCFAAATNHGLVSLVAVLGSIYPVVTAGIAAAVLRERLTPAQLAGAAAAMSGALVIAGSRGA